jgi:hypothetical protein
LKEGEYLMKNKALAVLIFLALALPFYGWAFGQAQTSEAADTPLPPGQEEAPPPQERFDTPGGNMPAAGNPTAGNPTPGSVRGSAAGLQSITRPMLEMLYKSGNDIKTVPYYVSDAISLEYSRASQNLEVTASGEVMLRELSVQNRVTIGRETMGAIVAVNYDTEGRMLLAVSFDESPDAYPLIFREGDTDRLFYLLYYAFNSGEKKIYYGDELYNIQAGESIPKLQIRFGESREERPSNKTLSGRRTR